MAIFARETGEGMGFEVELQHRPAEEDAAEAEVLALQPVASSAPPRMSRRRARRAVAADGRR